MDLQGKVALVTGAAAGIGLECVKMMVDNGVKHVAILDVNQTAGSAAAQNLNEKWGADSAIFIECDVTNKDDLEAAFKKTVDTFKKLHIVVNNAGIMRDNVWELEINLNITAVVRSTLLALEHMGTDKGGEGGVIVNVASIAGLFPVHVYPVYAATKSAVINFSRSMGVRFHEARTGVRVIALCPGTTEDTSIVAELHRHVLDEAWTEELRKSLGKIPSQKPGSVAVALLHILKTAKSGSVWVAEGGEPAYEVSIPHYGTLKVSH